MPIHGEVAVALRGLGLAAMTDVEIDSVMRAFDKDASGTVDYMELYTVVESLWIYSDGPIQLWPYIVVALCSYCPV